MQRTLIALVLLLWASIAQAQYNHKEIAAIDKPDSSGRVHLVILHTGTDVEKAIQDIYLEQVSGLEGIKALATAYQARLNTKATTEKAISVGLVLDDPMIVPPTPPAEPSDAEKAKMAFLRDRARLRNLMQFVTDTGGDPTSDVSVSDLRKLVLSEYDASYLSSF